MAVITATLQVQFTANTTGQHRVCWRYGSSGPYDCTTLVNCSAGNTCTVDIEVEVDNETCDQVEIEGYVQPTCEVEASTQGRSPFEITFTPEPACKRYVVTCNNVGVAFVTVTNQGSGYNPLSPPVVSITGGGGSGATATAVVGPGRITNTTFIFVGDPGSGYTNGSYVNVPLIGGSGTGATAIINISGGVITSAAISNQGTGYQDGDILSPDTTVVGTPSDPATMTVVSDYGQVLSINVTGNGSGYTSAPVVTVAPPSPGITAAATVIMQTCPDVAGHDCEGQDNVQLDDLALGDSVAMCSPSTFDLPGNFTKVEDGNCLCDCETVQVTNTSSQQGGGSIDVTFILCNGDMKLVTLPPQTSGVPTCVVAGSVHITTKGGNTTYTMSVIGPCQR
jgi:hypothetical protein